MNYKKIIFLILGIKLLFLFVIIGIHTYAPNLFNERTADRTFTWPEHHSFPIEKYFKTWDSSHYLYLADQGYHEGDRSSAFFPLWPFMIRLGLILPIHPVVMGWTLVTIVSIVAFLLFYYLASLYQGPGAAKWSLCFLLAFPSSIFYFFPYSEACFLLLSVLFFIFLYRNHFWGMVITVFLLPLVRPPGVFILLPLCYGMIHSLRQKKAGLSMWISLSLCAAAGFGFYFLLMFLWTGNPMAGIEAQNLFRYPEELKRSLSYLWDWNHFWKMLTTVKGYHHMFYSFLDRFWFLVALACMPAIWNINRWMFWYAVPLILFPPLTGSFMSLTRFIAAIFPIFFVWGAFFSKGKWTKLIGGVLIFILALMQISSFIYHINFSWVG